MRSPARRAAKSKRVQPKRRPQAGPARPARALLLGSRLNIAQAGDLHRTLAARVAAGGPIAVDGSQVEEIDTAILQLLASLWLTAAARGTPCAWQGASDVLRRTAKLLGVAEALHLADGESARGHRAAA